MKVIEFRELDVDSIRISDWAERTVIRDHEVEDLAESIRRGIQIEPIIVRRLGEESYELISGYMRLKALERLGLKKVEAKIIECSNEEALTICIEENLKRSDMHPFDIASKVAYMYKELRMSVREIGRRLGRDASWVEMMLKIDAISPEAKNLLAQKVKDTRILYEISKLDKPEYQISASETIIKYGLGRVEIQELVRRIKKGGCRETEEKCQELLQEPKASRVEGLNSSRVFDMSNTLQEYKGFPGGEASKLQQSENIEETRICDVCEEEMPKKAVRFKAICKERHRVLHEQFKLFSEHGYKKVEKVLEPIVENLDIFLSYPEDQQGEVIYNLIELARMVRGLDIEMLRQLVEEAKKSHA